MTEYVPPMTSQVLLSRLLASFPELAELEEEHRGDLLGSTQFNRLREGDVDGAFVFRDPKLDADLNLVFEQVKSVRGMSGYGWFANTIFHDQSEPKKQYAIDFWFKPEGDKLTLMDIRVQKGPKREGDGWIMITRLPVA
jgi:hypothetical protein